MQLCEDANSLKQEELASTSAMLHAAIAACFDKNAASAFQKQLKKLSND